MRERMSEKGSEVREANEREVNKIKAPIKLSKLGLLSHERSEHMIFSFSSLFSLFISSRISLITNWCVNKRINA